MAEITAIVSKLAKMVGAVRLRSRTRSRLDPHTEEGDRVVGRRNPRQLLMQAAIIESRKKATKYASPCTSAPKKLDLPGIRAKNFRKANFSHPILPASLS